MKPILIIMAVAAMVAAVTMVGCTTDNGTPQPPADGAGVTQQQQDQASAGSAGSTNAAGQTNGRTPAPVDLEPKVVPAPQEPAPQPQPQTAEKPEDNDNPRVRMITNKGPMIIELYPEEAPKTVENFLAYVDAGFYDNTIFHRVMSDFVLQGGGFELRDEQGQLQLVRKETRAPIVNEAHNGLKNERGTLSMARTNEVNSATSQFFINLKHNVMLDHRGRWPDRYGYAVFGKVVEGMDVADEIARVRTRPSPQNPNERSFPLDTVKIISAKRVGEAPAEDDAPGQADAPAEEETPAEQQQNQ